MSASEVQVLAERSPAKVGGGTELRLYAFLFSAALLVLPWMVKLDGHRHADWQIFLGRIHPLAVHLPIGFLLLVPVFEVAGAYRPALREAAGFVLSLGFFACIGALSLGYLLAYGSGEAGPGVTRHLWGGIALTICVVAAVVCRPAWVTGKVTKVYPVLLAAVIGVMGWAAHQGGAITHGSGYLTEYMPGWVKRWAGVGSGHGRTAGPESFYAKGINPIFDANCVSCHGQSKVRGGLRLDAYERLMRGGEHGAVVVAGRPEESVLFQRITLPAGHKQLMPAGGRSPLRAEEIQRIRTWILQGASPTTLTLDGVAADSPKGEAFEPVPDYSGLVGDIAAMDRGQGAKLVPVSRNSSDGLVLNAADVAASFGDSQLRALLKFAPYIVEAELGRTAITDASFGTLAKFSHLRALHLEDTQVTGEGIAQLSALSQLTNLNLSGTRVTKAAVAPLEGIKNLRRIYLFDAPADEDRPGEAAVERGAR